MSACPPESLLVYGIELPAAVHYPWGDGIFEEWFAKTEGLDQSAYRDKRDFWVVARTVFAACPARLICYGSAKSRRYILAAADGVVSAYPDSPQDITVEAFSRNKRRKWREALRAFCEKYCIVFDEPKLLLCTREAH